MSRHHHRSDRHEKRHDRRNRDSDFYTGLDGKHKKSKTSMDKFRRLKKKIEKKNKLRQMEKESEGEPRKLKYLDKEEGLQIKVVKPEIIKETAKESDNELAGFDPKRVLYSELKDLIELAIKAKETYRELPDGENASSVTMMLRELRDYTMEIYELTQEDREGIFDSLQFRVLQPLIMRIIRTMTSEYDSLRRQLIMACGDDKTGDIEKVLKTSLKNFKPLFQTEYKNALKMTKEAMKVDVDVEPLVHQLESAVKKE